MAAAAELLFGALPAAAALDGAVDGKGGTLVRRVDPCIPFSTEEAAAAAVAVEKP